jgi:xanthine dehydrogenase accessory factor
MTDQETFDRLNSFRKKGIEVCLATIVETSGSTPRETGAKMIICGDGTIFGSVGGGCGERQVISSALRCLLKTEEPAFLEISLSDDLGTKGGDVCGGKMWIFVEPIRNSFND